MGGLELNNPLLWGPCLLAIGLLGTWLFGWLGEKKYVQRWAIFFMLFALAFDLFLVCSATLGLWGRWSPGQKSVVMAMMVMLPLVGFPLRIDRILRWVVGGAALLASMAVFYGTSEALENTWTGGLLTMFGSVLLIITCALGLLVLVVYKMLTFPQDPSPAPSPSESLDDLKIEIEKGTVPASHASP